MVNQYTYTDVKRVCYCCGSSTSYLDKNKKHSRNPDWLHNHDKDDNVVCKKCYTWLFMKNRHRRYYDKHFLGQPEKLHNTYVANHQYYKQYRTKNAVYLAQKTAAWNKEQAIPKIHSYVLDARTRLRNLLGDDCVMCGFSGFRALQIDHIKGDGWNDYITGQRALFYLKHPDLARERLQLTCANCNWIKRYELKESRRNH
jgi:RNase P subunit RPR2